MAYKLENVRALIIDDDALMRRLLRDILLAIGLSDVDVAAEGISGFEAFVRLQYDLIVTDFQMSPINGVELIDLVRNSRKSPNPYIPIIMVSAYADRHRVENARDRGVSEFLAKPFSISQFSDRLAAIIETPRDFVRTAEFFGPDRRRRRDPNYSGPERRTNLALPKVRMA